MTPLTDLRQGILRGNGYNILNCTSNHFVIIWGDLHKLECEGAANECMNDIVDCIQVTCWLLPSGAAYQSNQPHLLYFLNLLMWQSAMKIETPLHCGQTPYTNACIYILHTCTHAHMHTHTNTHTHTCDSRLSNLSIWGMEEKPPQQVLLTRVEATNLYF